MINSPMRNKEEELHKMVSLQQDEDFIQACDILLRSLTILHDRSLLIEQSRGQAAQLEELLPFIMNVCWSQKHLSLPCILEFNHAVSGFLGADMFQVAQNSDKVDPQLKDFFAIQVTYNEGLYEIMDRFSKVTQISMEKINEVGHNLQPPQQKQPQQQQQQQHQQYQQQQQQQQQQYQQQFQQQQQQYYQPQQSQQQQYFQNNQQQQFNGQQQFQNQQQQNNTQQNQQFNPQFNYPQQSGLKDPNQQQFQQNPQIQMNYQNCQQQQEQQYANQQQFQYYEQQQYQQQQNQPQQQQFNNNNNQALGVPISTQSIMSSPADLQNYQQQQQQQYNSNIINSHPYSEGTVSGTVQKNDQFAQINQQTGEVNFNQGNSFEIDDQDKQTFIDNINQSTMQRKEEPDLHFNVLENQQPQQTAQDIQQSPNNKLYPTLDQSQNQSSNHQQIINQLNQNAQRYENQTNQAGACQIGSNTGSNTGSNIGSNGSQSQVQKEMFDALYNLKKNNEVN